MSESFIEPDFHAEYRTAKQHLNMFYDEITHDKSAILGIMSITAYTHLYMAGIILEPLSNNPACTEAKVHQLADETLNLLSSVMVGINTNTSFLERIASEQ